MNINIFNLCRHMKTKAADQDNYQQLLYLDAGGLFVN
jgi:hypothetical protein